MAQSKQIFENNFKVYPNPSELNGIFIDDNDENFNSFIIMMYNESQYL